MNKKAFVFADALVIVLVTLVLSSLCLSLFKLLDRQEEVYEDYRIQQSQNYEEFYNYQKRCLGCQIEET